LIEAAKLDMNDEACGGMEFLVYRFAGKKISLVFTLIFNEDRVKSS
jgi:hypothetical protein